MAEAKKTAKKATKPAKKPDVLDKLGRLEQGKRSREVSVLQHLLNLYGFSVNVTGVFGVETYHAVKEFQGMVFDHNADEIDGVVGPKTWEQLLLTDRFAFSSR